MEGELERMRDPRYFSHAWWNFTYLARGRYAEQLERWLELFPRERLLVDPERRPARAAARDVRARARVPRRAAARARRVPAHVRARVRADGRGDRDAAPEHFAEPNRRLYELLGRDLGWRR